MTVMMVAIVMMLIYRPLGTAPAYCQGRSTAAWKLMVDKKRRCHRALSLDAPKDPQQVSN